MGEYEIVGQLGAFIGDCQQPLDLIGFNPTSNEDVFRAPKALATMPPIFYPDKKMQPI